MLDKSGTVLYGGLLPGQIVDEAKRRMMAAVTGMPTEELPLSEACGRFIAADAHAPFDHPLFDYSAMDGYAFAFGAGPWRIVGEVAAGGVFPRPLAEGESVRIFTGAVMPAGADTVVMQVLAERQVDLMVHRDTKLRRGGNVRCKGEQLRTTQLRIGMVGPSAHGEQVQNWWHGVIGADRFDGWDHQLRDEPVLQLIHERRKRLHRHDGDGAWGWDLTRHWGASLGNFATYANVGGEWRFGIRLPDDFGTAPLRPAGENTSPVRAVAGRGWNGHLFVAADARWVLHDITLDGNSFKSSHSVDKRTLVADIGYGIAVTRGSWRFALARYHRSREFEGQDQVPVYGTFTIGKRF